MRDGVGRRLGLRLQLQALRCETQHRRVFAPRQTLEEASPAADTRAQHGRARSPRVRASLVGIRVSTSDSCSARFKSSSSASAAAASCFSCSWAEISRTCGGGGVARFVSGRRYAWKGGSGWMLCVCWVGTGFAPSAAGLLPAPLGRAPGRPASPARRGAPPRRCGRPRRGGCGEEDVHVREGMGMRNGACGRRITVGGRVEAHMWCSSASLLSWMFRWTMMVRNWRCENKGGGR